MAREVPEGSLVLLDACCLINLVATRRFEAVLGALPYRFSTSDWVADREVLSIRGDKTPSEGSVESAPLLVRSLAASGVITVLPIASEPEKAEVVRFAEQLDDGEASVCALATVHGGVVATDDRKAHRVLRRLGADRAILETPDLLYEWAELVRAGEAEIRAVLTNVEKHGRFSPRRDSPRFAWWTGFFT